MSTGSDRPSPTILVVEDNARALELRVDELLHAGCNPIAVQSHFDATRELTSSASIDLVMTDIHLGTLDGDQSGVDLARYIRRVHPGLPVIGYSAYFSDHELADERSAFDAVWSKADLTAVDQMIEDAVRRAIKYRSERKATSGQPMKVFLCHASEDKSTVETWYDLLEARGYEPWLDVRRLLPGDDWDYEIRMAVEASDVVVVALSANSVTKVGYVQREIRLVLDAADATARTDLCHSSPS
jgi:CheY-like chemotaxis protein